MAKAYLAQPTIYRLPVLIEMIADGQVLIPRFQRPFVWRDEQRLNLLDSIMRGMPIGSLLIWRTFSHKLETYEKLGPYETGQPKEGQERSYLLDGHQRLSSLYGAFREPTSGVAASEDDATNGKNVRWPIYADLGEQEVTFTLWPRNRKKSPPLTLLPVWKLLNPLELYEHQKELLDKGFKKNARRAEDLATQFKDYQIPVIPLVTEELSQVTQSFQRVNSQGTSMSEVHMVNALMWTRDFDLNQRLKEVAEELSDVGWGRIDAQTLLDVIKVSKDIDVYRGQPEFIKKELESDRKALDALVANMQAAARFLAAHCGVKGPAILPYKYQVVLLAEAARLSGRKLTGQLASTLERWFWRTTYGEYFTGMTGSQIRRAAEHVRALVKGEADELPEGLQMEVEPLHRFEFNSVRGRAFVLLLARHGAKGPDGKLTRADELVAEAGSDVVPKILTSHLTSRIEQGRQLAEGPENRWLVAPTHSNELLERIQKKPELKQTQAILSSHAIPPEAVEALQKQEHGEFLRLRRRYLWELEGQFVEEYGLRYTQDDEPA